MPHIRLDDNEIELSKGELRIGTGDEAQVRLDAAPEKGTLAIIIVDPSGTPTVCRGATGATILVNGVAPGAEPAPLLHGDRIEVAGRQLRFSADRKTGSTVLTPVISGEAPALAALGALNRARSRGRTSGFARRWRTAVHFGGVKVIFRSEPQLVDADGGARVIVVIKPSHQQRVPMARIKSLRGSRPLWPSARPSFL